jgi:hypothetical protein
VTDDLVTWLRAQLDEVQRMAGEAPPDEWDDPYGEFRSRGGPLFDHVLWHSPAQVLAEVEAKRRILDLIREPDDPNDDEQVWYQCALADVARLLALPYADRPGYRAEWAP